MKKVLVYAYAFHPSIGGMENISRTLACEFTKMGIEVVVATDTPSTLKHDYDFRVIRKPSTAQLFREAKQCDGIVMMPLSLRRAPVLLLSGKPIVLKHPHEMTGPKGELRLRDVVRRYLAMKMVNVTAGKFMQGKIPGSIIIPNSYNEKEFHSIGARPFEERTGVIFSGRLTPVKGAKFLIEAYANLCGDFPQHDLTIVGSGPDRASLEAQAEMYGVLDRIKFTGALSPPELANLLRCNRVAAIPSAYEEPFGIVALEALACGCIPVASENGGLKDATGGHAIYSRNGDAADLTEKLRVALTDDAECVRIFQGVDGHLRHHTPRVMAQSYLDAFELHKTSH